jgi:hypothetical protein
LKTQIIFLIEKGQDGADEPKDGGKKKAAAFGKIIKTSLKINKLITRKKISRRKNPKKVHRPSLQRRAFI